jgi:uncharacterized protein YecE (DUF72 family)
MHPQLQLDLFDDDPPPGPVARPQPAADGAAAPLFARPVAPVTPDAGVLALADRLQERFGDRLRLGTSSWHFPGWAGLVWDRGYPAATLSRHGLPAYAAHPLLRTVSLDRSFYRPLGADAYRGLATQVPAGFAFVVKAGARVCDAVLRDGASGRPLRPNPDFLDIRHALDDIVRPALTGLGERLGAIVFQLSPLPVRWLGSATWRAGLLQRLAALLAAVRGALPAGVSVGVEPRDAALLAPDFMSVLREHGARPVLGLHDRLPPLPAQRSLLRLAGPGDLLCRWNLQRGQRYGEARERWAPFDRLQSPDPETRRALARCLLDTLAAGARVFVTINNKAEGSAPRSVLALAEAIGSAMAAA